MPRVCLNILRRTETKSNLGAPCCLGGITIPVGATNSPPFCANAGTESLYENQDS